MRGPFEVSGVVPPGLTPNGVRYDDDLVSANGVGITMIPSPHHTAEDVAEASDWVRKNRDVVWVRVNPEAHWGWGAWYARSADWSEFLAARIAAPVGVSQ
jgi:hypothetical protein